MSYENIKGAWRTRKQALKHILAELVGGRLGAVDGPKGSWTTGCAYEAVAGGVVRHCGVGCLFNEAQIRSLKARGLNGRSIDDVSDVIGKQNIVTVTGLTFDELETIQGKHDGEWQEIQENPKSTDLYRYLTKELKV